MKIPIAPPLRDTDETAHTSGLVDSTDFVFDQTPDGFSMSKRPGLWAWWKADELPGVGVDGIFWWYVKSLLIVVVGGKAYSFTRPDAEPTEITSDLVRLHIGQQVSFETNGKWLLMSNGGSIVAWNGTDKAVNLADPRYVDSLAFMNSVFICNEQGTNNVRFTAPLLETESTIPTFLPFPFTPSASPDKLLAVHAGWSELLLFGPKSVEVWAYTGQSETAPFERISGAYIERGLGAKDSVVQADNRWFWLDHECKFVESNGRNVQVVSSPFDAAFRRMTRFDDAFTFAVMRRFICVVFPSGDTCFVFDLYNRGWSKWSYWNTELGTYERFLGQCAEFVPEWNTQFVGCRSDGRVAIMHQNLVTDFFGPIRARALTAHMDFGTMKRKQSTELMIRLKRGF